VAQLQFADPHRPAAVGACLEAVLHREERRRAVVVGNVPLDAAGDPRADQSDERRLDHVLPVEEVVAVGLVNAREDPSADLRRDTDLQVLVSR